MLKNAFGILSGRGSVTPRRPSGQIPRVSRPRLPAAALCSRFRWGRYFSCELTGDPQERILFSEAVVQGPPPGSQLTVRACAVDRSSPQVRPLARNRADGVSSAP